MSSEFTYSTSSEISLFLTTSLYRTTMDLDQFKSKPSYLVVVTPGRSRSVDVGPDDCDNISHRR